MTLKLVTRSALIIALFFLAAALAFAVITAYTPGLSGAPVEAGAPAPALARGISDVPHPVDVERFVNCADCHAIGARRAMPENHRTFSNENCSLCHLYPPPSEQAAQPSAGQVAHTFGWTSPLQVQAKDAFELPDPCAVGATLKQIITEPNCSVRADGVACVTCHNAERGDAGVRLDDLQGKQDLLDRGYIARFISANSAKPGNLKRLFADWQARGYPD